jgi:hypothetical protein
MSESDLKGKIVQLYGGFSFDGVAEVCNPYSVNHFFMEGKFNKFWVDNITKKTVANFFANRKIHWNELKGSIIADSIIESTDEISKNMEPALYLYLTGDLALRTKSFGISRTFRLVCPNLEARAAMAYLELTSYLDSSRTANRLYANASTAIIDADCAGFLRVCNRIFSKFPQRSQRFPQVADTSFKDGVFRDRLILLFLAADFNVKSEESSSLADAGIVAEHAGKTVVIELKYCDKGKDPTVRLQEATRQMVARNQGGSCAHPMSIAAVVSGDRRLITHAAFDGMAYEITGKKPRPLGTIHGDGSIARLDQPARRSRHGETCLR